MCEREQFFCSLFVFINMGFEDIIDQFHAGEFDPELYFGDYDTFFSILEKRKLMDRLDIEDSDIQNRLLLWLHKKNPSKFYEFVLDKLTDLDMDENGVIYLDLNDRSELSNFFCERSRNGLSMDSIKEILSGEYDNFFDYDTTGNVYSDVIEELSPKNMKHLREYVVENLKGQKIETETIELQDIAKEQGHPEYVTVDNPTTAQTIIDDEESMNYLLDTYLEDLNDQLKSIHNSAYSQAYESELYGKIFSELQEYINGNGEYYSKPHRFKKDTMTQRFRVPVASNFDQIILDYLDSNKFRGTSGLLEYWGDYIPMVQDDQDCLTVHYPDYPDFREVQNNINEIFTDYI
jgi:hypothetical protein